MSIRVTHAGEVTEFLGALRGGAPIAVDAAHAREIARVIDACYASSAAGGALTPVVNRTHDSEENRHVQNIARADAL